MTCALDSVKTQALRKTVAKAAGFASDGLM
ncbi:hypothetical protein LMG19083_02154 [Ralstonia psammae]|uniref:Uncharacterized protein n=1 Tax=Ralstonia psammae TaxID=3058598 RepID=A0ABM9JF82_9RALS|nr:hypothetical protein LMG19083_02154 [Ralstonia sp. LMG 19083]